MTKRLLMALASAGVFLCAMSGVSHAAKPRIVLLCGLTQGNWCSLNALAASLRAKGYQTSVHSHFAVPTEIAKGNAVYIGHSAGADRVVAYSYGARLVFSIDATAANIGAKSNNVVNYYNPNNRIPLFICCGGWKVAGAKNIIWRKSHTAMAADPKLYATIIAQIARLQ